MVLAQCQGIEDPKTPNDMGPSSNPRNTNYSVYLRNGVGHPCGLTRANNLDRNERPLNEQAMMALRLRSDLVIGVVGQQDFALQQVPHAKTDVRAYH